MSFEFGPGRPALRGAYGPPSQGAGRRRQLALRRARAFVERLSRAISWPRAPVWMAVACFLAPQAADAEEAYGPKRGDGHFANLSISNGLPNARIYAMAQDLDGFLWLGTQNGLARYDGHEITVYGGEGTGGGDGLADSYITALAASATGEIWVGTGRSTPLTGFPSRFRPRLWR